MKRLQTIGAAGLMMLGALVSSCGTGAEDATRHAGLDLVEIEADCDEAETRAVKAHKVAICHIPPGNPANAHTIVVSKNAKDAHLAHGDVLGGCSCEEIDHPGGGNPDGGGGDWDRPGNSDDTPGNKNGKPHDDPDGDDGTGTHDPEPSGDDGSGSGNDGTDGSGGEDSSPGDGTDSSDMCDADQTLCESVADCPSDYACDYGCCVYVIR